MCGLKPEEGILCNACRKRDKLSKSTRKGAIATHDKAYRTKKWAQYKVNHSKRKDAKYASKLQPYKEEEYITAQYVRNLRINQHNLCHYCSIPLQTEDMSSSTEDGLWIERLNDEVAHIKTNCVLSCSKCNMKRFFNPTPYKTAWLEKRKTENAVRAVLDEIITNVAKLTSICGGCVGG